MNGRGKRRIEDSDLWMAENCEALGNALLKMNHHRCSEDEDIEEREFVEEQDD